MNLLIVNLSLRPDNPRTIFPIGLGYIATAIKKAGYKFDLLDIDIDKLTLTQVESLLRGKQYDVIVYGCIVTGYRYVKIYSKLFRNLYPHASQICGNSVASSVPRILLDNTEVNIAIKGEGDKVIISILKKLEGKYPPHGIYSSSNLAIIEDINTLPMIDWDIFDVERYIVKASDMIPEPHPIPKKFLRVMPVNSARGCVARCTFCYHVFKDYRYRYRSINNLAVEINTLKNKYGVNFITFYDDLTLFSKKRASDFADMMMGKDVYWAGQCRADLLTEENRELAHRLKLSNCVWLGYSLESANADILKSMNKKLSLEDFSKQKKILDEVEIATNTSIVVGYPQETKDTLKETFDFCLNNNIYPSVGYLLPQPGSVMYDYALEHGFIPDEEAYLLRMGDRQDLTLNMTTIPSKELENLVVGHLKRIRDHLKLPLDDNSLIKTGVMKGR